jgi:hypothetical protein
MIATVLLLELSEHSAVASALANSDCRHKHSAFGCPEVQRSLQSVTNMQLCTRARALQQGQ